MRRSARCRMAVVAACWSPAVLAPSVARGGDDPAATREAEARFAEGLARMKDKDYAAARLSFAEAYLVLPRSLILWNLAVAEEKTSQPLDALAHFRQFARETPADSDRADAETHIEALLGQLSRIDVQAPAGAALSLDGNATATAPLAEPLAVLPGHHVLEARFAAGGTKRSEIDAVAGQVARVTFAPEAAPLAAAALPPAAPVSPEALPAAPPPPGAQAHQPFWTARTATSIVLLGAGVVAAGAGLYFGMESFSNEHTAEAFKAKYPSTYCYTGGPDCATWNDAVNAENRDAQIARALYFVGGAFAVAAGVSWFFWPKPKPGVLAWVAPEVGQQAVGVKAGGRF